jgi:hypothetical protein
MKGRDDLRDEGIDETVIWIVKQSAVRMWTGNLGVWYPIVFSANMKPKVFFTHVTQLFISTVELACNGTARD